MLRFFVLCLLGLSPVRAEEWPQLRGPTGHGHYSGKLPTKWSEKENIAWSVDVPGLGWSSPVTVDGKTYLTTAVENDDDGYSLRAICIETATGKLLWNTEIFVQPQKAPKIHSKNSHASPTPVVSAGKCYVHFGHMGTACLDTSGKILWKQTEHSYKPVHGNGGSLCLVENHLIFSIDGEDMQAVIALDAASGATVWKVERKAKPSRNFSFGTPLHIVHDGVSQVICAGSDVVMSLDPKTGNEFWRLKYKGYSQIPVPIYHQGLIYICTGYDTPKLLAIRAGGKGDVTETHLAWQVGRNIGHTPTPVLVDNLLFTVADNGVMSCLDASTGEQRWQQRVPGNYSASVLHADKHLYVLNEQGVCTVVEAAAKFKEVSKNTLPGRTLASPTPYQGKLLLRTDTKLYCIQ